MTFSKEYLQKKSAILQKALNPNIILPNNEKLDSVNSNKLDIWKYKHTNHYCNSALPLLGTTKLAVKIVFE